MQAGDLYEGYEGDKSAAIVSLDKIEYETHLKAESLRLSTLDAALELEG